MKPKLYDKDITVRSIRGYVYLSEFTKYHKKRVKILKEIFKKYSDVKLVNSMVILGFESMAKIRYPKDTVKKRLVKLLSKVMKRNEAERFYYFYRCAYIHDGMINPMSDNFGDEYSENDNIVFMDNKSASIDIAGFTDYPPETLISMYEGLTYYIKDYFEKKGISYRILKLYAYSDDKYMREFKKKLKRQNRNLTKI